MRGLRKGDQWKRKGLEKVRFVAMSREIRGDKIKKRQVKAS